jgi:hypothetical protein
MILFFNSLLFHVFFKAGQYRILATKLEQRIRLVSYFSFLSFFCFASSLASALMGACCVSLCGHVQAGSEWSFHVPTTLLSDAERMVFGGLSAVMAQVCPLHALFFVFYRLLIHPCITVVCAAHRNRQSPPAKRRYGPSNPAQY